jgi:hypothetical protein
MTTDYLDPADMDDLEGGAITLEYGDIKMACKITRSVINPFTGDRVLNYVPYEDSIHPYPLAFDPPLIEHAVGEKNGFAHHWEKLNYAFGLPDPRNFPELATLTDDDKTLLRRYAKVCRQLAGYSALNMDSGLAIHHRPNGQPDVILDFPSDEAFAGTSLAFRQLHSQQEAASFDVIKGRVMKAIKLLPDAEQDAARKVVTQWSRARAALMNRMLQNIVAEKAAPPVPKGNVFPFSYCNIEPQKLILTFQYGDVIHFSGEQENLAKLVGDERNAAYYKHAVLGAIVNLSHLYFGFALLAEAAVWQP